MNSLPETDPVFGGFLAFRLKTVPEDFQVFEEVDLPRKIGSPVIAYRFVKRGWNTVDALDRISRKFGVPVSTFSYGGKKDRHAVTEQVVTAPSGKDYSIEEKDFRLVKIGPVARAMEPGLILSNRFRIVLRSMHGNEIPVLQRNIKKYRESLFPNYFDQQRFGCVHPVDGLPGIRVLAGEYEKALRAAVCCYSGGEKGPEKRRRNRLFEIWGDWKACREIARGPEIRIFELLQKESSSVNSGFEKRVLAKALGFLPRENLSLYFSAAQSRIWNCMLRRKMELSGSTIRIKNGVDEPALRETAIGPEEAFSLTLPAEGVNYSEEWNRIYHETLDELGIPSADFRTPLIERSFFSSYEREGLILARNLAPPEIEEDELYPGRKKATIEFALPRGAYGTILIKCLTLREKKKNRERADIFPANPES